MIAHPVAFFGGAPGGVELVVVLAVFLMLFGARRVPEMARSMGRILEQLRRSARDLSDDLLHADLDEAASSPPPFSTSPDSEEAQDDDLPSEEAGPANADDEGRDGPR